MAVVTDVPTLGTPQNWEELEQAFAGLQLWLGNLNGRVRAANDTATSAAAATAQRGDTIFVATRANVPAMSASDEGTVYWVSDFAHLIRWSGTAWAFMDGGNRFFADHELAPGTGWALCDGSTVDALTLGATLSVTSVTLPNLSGLPSYKRSNATYSSTLVSAIAPGATATATATVGSESAHTHSVDPPDTGSSAAGGHSHSVTTGTTASESAHTHAVDPPATTSGLPSPIDVFVTGVDNDAGTGLHTHSVDIAEFTSGAGSAHSHGPGTLGTDTIGNHTHSTDIAAFTSGAGSAHTHSATVTVNVTVDATAEPRKLNVLPYYRL